MKKFSLSAVALALLLSGCATTGDGSKSGSGTSAISSVLGAATAGGSSSSSTENKAGAALDVFKAVTVSDEELKTVSLQYRNYEDRTENAAPANNKYAQRLARLTRKHVNEDGMKLNFKVYLSKDVNANATADGSIRVYSGLMDMMNDQELLGVIGHEIGHVKLQHSLSAMRTAYMASAGRKAASAAGGVGRLADSDLGALGEKLVNSQFSQSQETAADDYGLAFMKKHKYKVQAMESAFRKIASLSGKSGGMDAMLSTHPDAGGRADRMRDLASAK
ncbi:M48 family metallopeptidase [Acidovorax sp. SUPP2539]|uniref:M48 family metallopeptidase n=1 Tax=Acidovorax sp. SUPP2539 TaxID=2920878 RepID=UPI0023DE39D7|nr:M48 family metallopeptidase [Acidovorax sp. SUPP2539]GKS89701.1 M48 family metallopeptidase [Acidovorax sp. SUPP2539]